MSTKVNAIDKLKKVLGKDLMDRFLCDCSGEGYDLRGLSDREIAWIALRDMHTAFSEDDQSRIIEEIVARTFDEYGLDATDDDLDEVMDSYEIEGYKDDLMLESEKQLAGLKEKLEEVFDLYDEDGYSTLDEDLEGYDDWDVYDDIMQDQDIVWDYTQDIFNSRKEERKAVW